MEIGPDDDFPALIKQLRTNLGLSQAQASRRGGLDGGEWSRVERYGYRQMTWKMGLQMLSGVGIVVEGTYRGAQPHVQPELAEELAEEPTLAATTKTPRARIRADG